MTSEPANIAELRRIIAATGWAECVTAKDMDTLLARSERLERAVELLRKLGKPLDAFDPMAKKVDALLAEHDAAKEAT